RSEELKHVFLLNQFILRPALSLNDKYLIDTSYNEITSQVSEAFDGAVIYDVVPFRFIQMADVSLIEPSDFFKGKRRAEIFIKSSLSYPVLVESSNDEKGNCRRSR